jgi:hypothetical protein
MKKFAAIFGVIAAVFGVAEAKLGFGGCPKLTTTVPFDDDMTTLSKIRIHYFDRLPQNLFTLANILIAKQYKNFDCFGYDDQQTIQYVLDNYLASATQYNDISDKYLSGSEYGFTGGVTSYNADRNEFIVSACLDATGFATLLTGKILAGKPVPDSAKTAIKIATMFFKFIHFQITAVVSDKTTYDAAETADVVAQINKVPGMKVGYLANLKQDDVTCPNGGALPSM